MRGTVSTKRGLSADSRKARPQLLDGGVQSGIELHECVAGPEFFLHFLSSNDHAWSFPQQRKKVEGQVLQPDAKAALGPLTAIEIRCENTEARNPALWSPVP